MSYQKRLDSESFRILTPSHPGPAIYLPPVTPLAFGKVAWWALKSWHSCSIPIISPWFHHVTIWNVIADRWKKASFCYIYSPQFRCMGRCCPNWGWFSICTEAVTRCHPWWLSTLDPWGRHLDPTSMSWYAGIKTVVVFDLAFASQWNRRWEPQDPKIDTSKIQLHQR